jgi:hypothetical protein
MCNFVPLPKTLSQSSTVRWYCEKAIRISVAAGYKAMPRDGTKLALFIDGINTHAAARALGFDKGSRPVFVTLLLANVCFGSLAPIRRR